MNDATLDVLNQPPPLVDFDALGGDPWLRGLVPVEAIPASAASLGTLAGSAEAQQHAEAANRFTPELRTHDRFGHRIDAVEYHPSYHWLMERAIHAGVHSTAWKRERFGFSARAVLVYLWNQLEHGTSCPLTMTFASIPVLEHAPAIDAAWRPKVLADLYDPRALPLGRKDGVTIGMAMTERQGGSDLRAISTVASPASDGHYRLTGHKWFCSAPMSDAFFTLARLPEGVTCFFVARSLPDGERNPFLIQRLKDKCGNRSNASAEIDYRDTFASLVGEPGRGIATLIEMAHHTRFDIVVAVAAMMRFALNQAIHHARHREAFGKRLADHALMANVLADLALETEAAARLAFRLATAFDGAEERERELQRALTPIAKYWLCKRLPPLVVEAMECLGGNGYVDEWPLARLYREAPLNGIWEGSANVICLDVLRALNRSPAAFAALADEIAAARDPRLDRLLAWAGKRLADRATAESGARSLVEALALGMQASLMKRGSDANAAEVFLSSRLDSSHAARAFGTLSADTDCAALVARAALRS